MGVDAVSAADFPGYGAEGGVGFGFEHGVQGLAVAVHFFVGCEAGVLVWDAG